MKSRKSKGSLRDKLSADYLKIFQEDFAAHGAKVIAELRQRSPEKYSEIASRLIAATEPDSPMDFSKCHTIQDIGRKLLQSVGCNEPTDDQIAEAVEANDVFIARLEAIRAIAEPVEGELN
jgi:hypothetical protein